MELVKIKIKKYKNNYKQKVLNHLDIILLSSLTMNYVLILFS